MDEQSAYELTHAISQLVTKLDTNNARQDETNDLIRSLIDALNSNSQELLEMREHLQKQGQ
ncbi:hypothetical protein [Paracoccus yeei]|uniref:hypothetical protein n=1 Tax=Paracoccus yeei TaxID=147645 RepID=UPI001C8EAEE8|nr:hypothetical protein [Paracoccus yeei]MBY0135564.1 hypothetical protein [Paracoccus yeei]